MSTIDISAKVIGLDPAAAEAELPTTRRTVRQVDAYAVQLQRRLEQAVIRGGASALYRIDVAAWEHAGRFDISMIRRADDTAVATGSGSHHASGAELYRLGADVFHAGLAAEIDAILAERNTTAGAEQ